MSKKTKMSDQIRKNVNCTVSHALQNQSNEDVDFLRLWSTVWEQKYLTLLTCVVVMAISLIYLWVTQPIYRATVYLLPPLTQDVQELNENNTLKQKGIALQTTVYLEFQKNMRSRQLRSTFFKQHDLYNLFCHKKISSCSDRWVVFEEYFNQKLNISQSKIRGNDAFVTVSFETGNRIRGPELLNSFVRFISATTAKQLTASIVSEINYRKRAIGDEISGLRKIAFKRRMDRVARLQEALVIAEAIRVTKHTISEAANQLNMEYMRGSAAIKSEISVLKERKNDDPFVEGVRTLQEQIGYLNSIIIDPNNVRPVTVDQFAVVPTKAIWPQKKLVLILSLVLGLGFGVAIVLLRRAILSSA